MRNEHRLAYIQSVLFYMQSVLFASKPIWFLSALADPRRHNAVVQQILLSIPFPSNKASRGGRSGSQIGF
ncbi:hypothetical protein SAMN05216436_10156 [bacterium A37T11]|nr:hypothetical protein SAMN05216436_10156 [bacterium A37T11]